MDDQKPESIAPRHSDPAIGTEPRARKGSGRNRYAISLSALIASVHIGETEQVQPVSASHDWAGFDSAVQDGDGD